MIVKERRTFPGKSYMKAKSVSRTAKKRVYEIILRQNNKKINWKQQTDFGHIYM